MLEDSAEIMHQLSARSAQRYVENVNAPCVHRELVGFERDQWIDSRSSPRRHDACDRGDRDNHHSYPDVAECVRGRHAVEERRQVPHQDVRRPQTRQNTGDRNDHRVLEHEPHVSCTCAPSAVRIPNSRARCATLYDSTPNRPTPAIARAAMANVLSNRADSRGFASRVPRTNRVADLGAGQFQVQNGLETARTVPDRTLSAYAWSDAACATCLLPMCPRLESRVAELTVTITCPTCAKRTVETMPTDRCVIYYECGACGSVIKPKAGDCCVYCSYGDRRCPFIQDSTPCPG
jgi:hypothetical protein